MALAWPFTFASSWLPLMSAIAFASICKAKLESFLLQSQAAFGEVDFWAWLEEEGLMPPGFCPKGADCNNALANMLEKEAAEEGGRGSLAL